MAPPSTLFFVENSKFMIVPNSLPSFFTVLSFLHLWMMLSWLFNVQSLISLDPFKFLLMGISLVGLCKEFLSFTLCFKSVSKGLKCTHFVLCGKHLHRFSHSLCWTWSFLHSWINPWIIKEYLVIPWNVQSFCHLYWYISRFFISVLYFTFYI